MLTAYSVDKKANGFLLYAVNSAVLVGLAGLEPATPRLSSVCSNQLSYKPYSWLELKSLAQSNSQLLLTQPISVNACNQAFL